VQLDAAGRPGLDVELALVEGQSAIDKLCRFALARYQHWAREIPGPLEVSADGTAVELAPDGTFDAPGAQMLLVRDGSAVTVLAPPLEGPPFPDSRLD
jgi:hypothetical protein